MMCKSNSMMIAAVTFFTCVIQPMSLCAAKYSTRILGYPTMVYRGDMIHIEDDYGFVDKTLNITNQMDLFQLYKYVNSNDSGTSMDERAYYNDSDMGIVGKQIWSMTAQSQSSIVSLINSQDPVSAGLSIYQAINLHEHFPKLLPNNSQHALESWDLWTCPSNFSSARDSVLPLFADVRVSQNCTSAATYESFLSWAGTIGQSYDSIMNSATTWVSYRLGADRLFKQEPKVELANISLSSDGAENVTMALEVVVRDGEDVAAVASEKVAAMFEATSDLRDWEGPAKLEPNAEPVTVGKTSLVTVKVTPGDGSSQRAFLRLKND